MKKQLTSLAVIFAFAVLSTNFIDLSKMSNSSSVKNKVEKIKLANKIYPHSDFFSSEEKETEGEKMDEPQLFAKYQMEIRTRNGEDKPSYPDNYRIKELLKARKVSSAKELPRTALGSEYTWIERGPGNIGGRTRAIAVDPDDATGSTFYVGSVGGGVWKTTDGGDSWINLTPQLPNLATSTIAQSQSNPDVMYVGTGEGFNNVDQIDGTGIWKTTDRGETWEQLVETTDGNAWKNIMRIVVDPANPDIVIAASAPGFNGGATKSYIYKSTDGGATWTAKYNSANSIQQIVADPNDFSKLYATVNSEGVIKSNNSGDTWNSSSAGIDEGARFELSVSPVNTNNIFMSVYGGSTGTLFYYSIDAGKNWTKIVPNLPWLGGQGWYDNTICAHPFDENTFYVGGVSIFKGVLNNGNLTESVVVDGYGQFGGTSKGVHVDQHNITAFVTDAGTNKFRMIVGNDGGIYVSDDAGTTFKDANTGYNTTQFYGIDKKNGADEYIGGMQDNSSWRSPAGVSADSISSWVFQWGGDGYESSWHYTEPNKMLVSSQYNNVGRSLNGGQSFSSVVNQIPDVGSSGAPFFTKIAKSKQDPDLIFLMGASGIWRSPDFGTNWRNIKVSGGSLAGTSTFSQIKISMASPQIIWAGSNVDPTFGLYVSTNGGYNFDVSNGYTEVDLGRITGLATHPTDPNTAYATFSFADAPKILRTTDLGQTWEDISGFGTNDESSTGFPDVAVFTAITMPFDNNIIWAGTEIGIFETTDNAASWHFLSGNLPAVAIYDLAIVNDQVIAATHGRGIWSVSLPELSGYEPPEVLLAPILNGVTASNEGLVFDINFRELYDSTQILINDKPLKTVYNTSTGSKLDTVKAIVETTGSYELKIVSFAGDQSLASESFDIELFSLANPVASYATNFSVDDGVFLGTEFSIKREFGFSGDNAIHSKHPYVEEVPVTYTLTTPFVVSATDGFIKYKDIALIEPGEPGSKFGDADFYDYVVVEGTKDGVSWTPLANGYDARLYSDWLNAYSNPTTYYALYKEHEINLLNTFSAGDVILIRFKLFSDPLVTGWGWAIDDLQIQEELVGVNDNEQQPIKFDLAQNYPNPFNPSTMIKFSIPENSKVSLKIFDSLGREVETLVNQQMNSGIYQVNWHASAYASGVYFYKINAGKFSSTKKMMLLK